MKASTSAPNGPMDFETSLRVLSVLTDALAEPRGLDEGLEYITNVTGTLMGTEQTVLLLRDEEREELIVRNRVGIDDRRIRVGHPMDVPARLKSILWRVRRLRQIGWVEAGIEAVGFPILVVPLRIKGQRIGLLITGKSRDRERRFDPIRRQLYTLVASFASLVIENAKVYDYLRQQFAQRSAELARANERDALSGDPATQLTITSLNNPNKVIRLLAESFYKELKRAGFAPGHITTAAAHILDCITRQETVTL